MKKKYFLLLMLLFLSGCIAVVEGEREIKTLGIEGEKVKNLLNKTDQRSEMDKYTIWPIKK